MLRGRRGERGTILVLTAVLMVVFMGFAALAIDGSMAWSNRRVAQGAVDTATMAALQAIPRTLTLADAVLDATAEAQAFADVNAPGSLIDDPVVITGDSTGQTDLDVTLRLDSPTTFARVIGAPDVVTIAASASGRIDFTEVDRLYPLGFQDALGQPAQCFEPEGAIPQFEDGDPLIGNEPRVCHSTFQGHLNSVLDMKALDPPSCAVRFVTNMHDGVDHLVDTDADTLGQRSESVACGAGHKLTLPNAADEIVPSNATMTQALIGAGGPLASSSAPLWTYLRTSNSAVCDPSDSSWDITAVPPDPLAAPINWFTLKTRTCLQSWDPGDASIFNTGVTSSPRFGWGIDYSGSGTVDFDEVVPIFLNSVVSDDPAVHEPPEVQEYLDGGGFPGQVGAFTMFALHPDMLSSGDEAGLKKPAGTDSLILSLTN